MRVAEYLIRAADRDVLIIHQNDLAHALHPRGIDCAPVEGWGDYRMTCGNNEVAVSFDDPGIHLIIEGEDTREAKDTLAGAIAAQVDTATGRGTYVVPL